MRRDDRSLAAEVSLASRTCKKTNYTNLKKTVSVTSNWKLRELSYPELRPKVPVEHAQDEQGRPDPLLLRQEVQQHLQVGGVVVGGQGGGGALRGQKRRPKNVQVCFSEIVDICKGKIVIF